MTVALVLPALATRWRVEEGKERDWRREEKGKGEMRGGWREMGGDGRERSGSGKSERSKKHSSEKLEKRERYQSPGRHRYREKEWEEQSSNEGEMSRFRYAFSLTPLSASLRACGFRCTQIGTHICPIYSIYV